MKIKEILDEIAGLSGKKDKIETLAKYKDNSLLREVIYLAHSPRVKFFIKQIPEYKLDKDKPESLEWALIGLQNLSNRVLTGSEAIFWLKVVLSSISSDNAYVIERVIGKDLKIGMDSGVNKAIPGLIEETGYMGCQPFNEKKARAFFDKGNSALSEVKADGRYVNVIITSGEVEMTSRQGEPSFLGNCDLVSELSKLEDCVLNGELVMEGYSRLISNGILASLIDYNLKFESRTEEENKKKYVTFFKEKGLTVSDALSKVRLKTWDILSIDDFYNLKSDVKRSSRLSNLKGVVKDNKTISVVEHRFVNSYQEALAHFAEVLERGEEGTVLKTLDGGWKNGKPVYQLKLKIEISLDLKITGFNYGEKGKKNENVISSITCESSCGKLVANAHGLTEARMKYVTENQDSLLGTILEVKCNGLSSNSSGGNSVFYPSAEEFRTDKTEANSFEECVEIQNSVLGLK